MDWTGLWTGLWTGAYHSPYQENNYKAAKFLNS